MKILGRLPTLKWRPMDDNDRSYFAGAADDALIAEDGEEMFVLSPKEGKLGVYRNDGSWSEYRLFEVAGEFANRG